MAPIIAHLNVSRGYRGGERQTELLIRELAKRNIRQMLIARRNEPLASRIAALGIEVREVSGQIAGSILALAGAGLVHVHEGRSVYAAWLKSHISHTPYVITRRVDNPIGDHFMAHRAYRRAGIVAAVAPQVADIVRAFDSAIDVCVVRSSSSGLSVEPDRSRAILDRFSGRFLVGHVGALDIGQKAQDVIVSAARRLLLEQPDVHFVLVGGGNDKERIERMAEGLPNLTLTGFVENVGDYLAAFDLFILPSRKEGIGSILLDAMEHGLAVVATRVGGVPDIVEQGRNGLLIEPEKPSALVDAILALYREPELRSALGRAGVQVAMHHTARHMCERYVGIYERLIGPIGS